MWFRGLAYRSEENSALALCVGTEEADDFVIVERQASGSETESISRQIHLAAEDSRLQLHGTVTTIARGAEPALQIGEEKDRDSGVAS